MNKNRLRSILSDFKNGHATMEETVALLERSDNSGYAKCDECGSVLVEHCPKCKDENIHFA